LGHRLYVGPDAILGTCVPFPGYGLLCFCEFHIMVSDSFTPDYLQ